MLLLIAGCAALGLAVSAGLTALMRRLAPRLGLIDQPAARKVHAVPTPLGGGLAIAGGVVAPLAAAQLAVWAASHGKFPASWIPPDLAEHLAGVTFRSGQLWTIVAAGAVILILGLIDDRRALRWQPKLFVQFAVAVALVTAGIRATLFVEAPWIGWIATVLWIVVLTNAFNFLDNMDGLAGGIGMIAASMFAAIMLTGTSEPHWFVAGFLLLIAGSLGGFLFHNWSPAKIFMGDAGSCLVGMWLACMTVVGTFYDYRRAGTHVILAPLCVLAVPLYDFCSVVLIRLSQGRSPFHADKCHFSHRLVELGMTRKQAVLTIHLVTLTTGLAGLLLYQVGGWPAALLVVLLVVCMLAVIAILETAGRLHSSNAGAAATGPASPSPAPRDDGTHRQGLAPAGEREDPDAA
ncbi:MAG: undecaprenyl/decaprenyl-phosphate alpha-N-acetylglucosaminyl 1-phosphate transferase [Planctomycetia bacterium]|nr:undecaprenyl/decaprenyl-phosphate alpha-N-acetylglucosaminyl 1-phosphate transferase [Planctomycetia bacterium]